MSPIPIRIVDLIRKKKKVGSLSPPKKKKRMNSKPPHFFRNLKKTPSSTSLTSNLFYNHSIKAEKKNQKLSNQAK